MCLFHFHGVPSMAPFYKAVNVQSGGKPDVYTGVVDSEWLVGSVPHGGYVLALMVEACIQHQSGTAHKDPIHVTAHFLRASSATPFEIYIRTVKSGRGFTNLTVELLQKGQTRVTSHMIFGTNAPPPPGPSSTQAKRVSIDPPSPYARQIPLHVHPSKALKFLWPLRKEFRYNHHLKTTHDPILRARNAIDSPTRTMRSTIGGGGLEWGGWLEFVDKNERITSSSLAFLADMFINMVALLPEEIRGDNKRDGLVGPLSWFPTIVLALEFKTPIPRASDVISGRTVGIYSNGRFLNDPDHRHDTYVEVWSAPCNIGEGEEPEDSGDWRSKQVCLATATQMSLTMPPGLNVALGKKASRL